MSVWTLLILRNLSLRLTGMFRRRAIREPGAAQNLWLALSGWVRRWVTKRAMSVVARLPRGLRDDLVLRLVHADTDALNEVVVKLAETPAEHEQAARLVFESYAACGLLESHGVRLRVNAFLLLPTTLKFVAVLRGEVIATLSLIQDSGLGLPMEGAYGAPVEALRTTGRRIAEIGALAVKPEHRRHGLTMLLYKAMWRMASTVLRVDDLVVAVRPAAEIFYSAVLRFERLTSDQNRYPGLNTNSVALHLNLRTAPALFERVFEKVRRGRFNPRVFFVKDKHPHLHLPASDEELEPLRRAHRLASMRLVCLRPDAVMSLDVKTFAMLRRELVC